MNNERDFTELLAKNATDTDRLLAELLSEKISEGEIFRPARLLSAMRHGALGGGKRIRPYLLLETARMLGADRSYALQAATAIECVHCYSLIHDDLPAMDDDDLRRGKPTVHKAFDEATAILAGDSLLTLSFDILADQRTHPDARVRTELVSILAKAAGAGGMAGGQMLDLEAENKALSADGIQLLQSMKTGALIRASCEAGAVISNATREQRQSLSRFGELVGKAFQLADDILDITSTTEILGKQSAKDEQKGKATMVSLMGLAESRALMKSILDEAVGELAQFGEEARPLTAAAFFTVERNH